MVRVSRMSHVAILFTFCAMALMSQLQLDTTVSLQTVIGIAVWLITVAVYFTTVRDDMKTIKDWTQEHQKESKVRDETMGRLELIVERLTILMEQSAKRIDRIEQQCDRRHNGGENMGRRHKD